MTYKTYEQMNETERRNIVNFVISLAGLSKGNMPTHPSEWKTVEAVKLPPEPYLVVDKCPQKGETFWSQSASTWTTATFDWTEVRPVKVTESKVINGTEVTNAHIGRLVRLGGHHGGEGRIKTSSSSGRFDTGYMLDDADGTYIFTTNTVEFL